VEGLEEEAGLKKGRRDDKRKKILYIRVRD
jgi:hypothetical protein